MYVGIQHHVNDNPTKEQYIHVYYLI
jgi:hypothetical protein